jgi:hypothetical protein
LKNILWEYILTISNAALPHYSPEEGQDRVIDIESTYVIDAGAQYFGTKPWLPGTLSKLT